MQYVYNSCLYSSAAAALCEAIYDFVTAMGNNSPSQALDEMTSIPALRADFSDCWTLDFEYNGEMFAAAAAAVKAELQSR